MPYSPSPAAHRYPRAASHRRRIKIRIPAPRLLRRQFRWDQLAACRLSGQPLLNLKLGLQQGAAWEVLTLGQLPKSPQRPHKTSPFVIYTKVSYRESFSYLISHLLNSPKSRKGNSNPLFSMKPAWALSLEVTLLWLCTVPISHTATVLMQRRAWRIARITFQKSTSPRFLLSRPEHRGQDTSRPGSSQHRAKVRARSDLQISSPSPFVPSIGTSPSADRTRVSVPWTSLPVGGPRALLSERSSGTPHFSYRHKARSPTWHHRRAAGWPSLADCNRLIQTIRISWKGAGPQIAAPGFLKVHNAGITNRVERILNVATGPKIMSSM